jgi:hypothetical protein
MVNAPTDPTANRRLETAAAADPSVPPEVVKELAEESERLKEDNAVLQNRYNDILQWILDNYRGKFPLTERLVSFLRIAPVNEAFEVHPDLVDVLRMTDNEKVLVQDIFNYVRDNIREIERANGKVVEQTDSKITFSFPTYEEAGRGLRDDLLLTLETTLGGARFDRMVDISGEKLREQFHYFGEASRTLTFEIIYPEVEGDHDPYLLIRDGWMVPDGPSVRLSKVTETAVTEIPAPYRDYQDLLPDKLNRYATP